MTGRIEEHPPRLTRLVLRDGRPELDAPLFGGGDVGAGEVEVELLAPCSLGQAGGR